MPSPARRSSTLVVLSILVSLGCGNEPTRQAPRRSSRAAATAEEPAAAPVDPLYDADGNLLPTDVLFMGLPIPVTFELQSNSGGHVRYASDRVPLWKLRAYVSRRVETTHVRAIGSSAYFFESATVRDVPSNGHLLDVSVSNTTRGVALELVDRAPVDYGDEVTQADRERAVREAWRRQSQQE